MSASQDNEHAQFTDTAPEASIANGEDGNLHQDDLIVQRVTTNIANVRQ